MMLNECLSQHHEAFLEYDDSLIVEIYTDNGNYVLCQRSTNQNFTNPVRLKECQYLQDFCFPNWMYLSHDWRPTLSSTRDKTWRY